MTDQYFSVPHRLPINVLIMPEQAIVPDLVQLEQEIPAPFKLASEVSTLDQGTVRALRNMGDIGDEISNFLELQARKINVIMGYLLSLQDDPSCRHSTCQFGASEFSYLSDKAINPGQLLQVKLFLHDEAAAIYAYARVLACHADHSQPLSSDDDANDTPAAQTAPYTVVAKFVTLREEDRELLIRATLHVQSKLLKQRAEQRKGEQA